MMSALRALGVPAGGRIGVGIGISMRSIALLQAGLLGGWQLVLLNRRLTTAELADQVARAGLAAAIADPDHPLAALPGTTAIPEVWTTPTWQGTMPTSGGLVLFTSGTTGRAKAARLSAAAVVHSARGTVARLGLSPHLPYLVCMPLDHIGGAAIAYRALVSGMPVLPMARFDAEQANALIDAGTVRGASLVPTMLHRLVEARAGRPWPASLRVLLIGGGPLPLDLIGRCTALGLAPCQTYGMTEGCGQICTQAPDEAALHPGSAGTPLPGMALRIVDGQIQVRGPGLFVGYDPIDGVQAPGPDADGWFASGDLGRLDEHGHLHVYCRRDDLILSGAENIYPAEVEAALTAIPGISDACVVGIDDPEWGQVVAAALATQGAPMPEEALRAAMGGRLARYKHPRLVRWCRELPRTSLGKIRRHEVRAWFSPR